MNKSDTKITALYCRLSRDVYYHGVGIIRLASAEEMEASFQKHIEDKNKQKTA